MYIDIISDLHIDKWLKHNNTNLDKDYIFNFEEQQIKSDYLIIAGDISDKLDDTIDFLNYSLKYYKKILFVDGNHEHFEKFPKLYNNNYIKKKIKNKKIIYLRSKSFIIDDIAFIGCNGWFNYNNKDKNIINKMIESTYFDRFNINNKLKIKLIQNIITKSKNDFLYLNNEIKKYDLNNKIKKIVIITHTIPNTNFGFENKFDKLNNNYITQFNTNFYNLYNSKKIVNWIFGHVHGYHNVIINNIHYICNPRGNPKDYNRKTYKKEVLLI